MKCSMPILGLVATLGLTACPEDSHDGAAAPAMHGGSQTISAMLPYLAAPGESSYALTTARLTP